MSLVVPPRMDISAPSPEVVNAPMTVMKSPRVPVNGQ